MDRPKDKKRLPEREHTTLGTLEARVEALRDELDKINLLIVADERILREAGSNQSDNELVSRLEGNKRKHASLVTQHADAVGQYNSEWKRLTKKEK